MYGAQMIPERTKLVYAFVLCFKDLDREHALETITLDVEKIDFLTKYVVKKSKLYFEIFDILNLYVRETMYIRQIKLGDT